MSLQKKVWIGKKKGHCIPGGDFGGEKAVSRGGDGDSTEGRPGEAAGCITLTELA